MTKPTEAEKLAKRDAAKKRVAEWWDKPEHKPTKELEEKARHGTLPDPKKE